MLKLLLITLLAGALAACERQATSPSQAVSAASAASAPLPAPKRPRYMIEDKGRYGYRQAISANDAAAGAATKPLVMLAYIGIVHAQNTRQLIEMDDSTMKSAAPRWLKVYDYEDGKAVLTVSIFRDGKFYEKKLFPAEPMSIPMMAFADANDGFLKIYRHPAKSKAGKWLYVRCEERAGCQSDNAP